MGCPLPRPVTGPVTGSACEPRARRVRSEFATARFGSVMAGFAGPTGFAGSAVAPGVTIATVVPTAVVAAAMVSATGRATVTTMMPAAVVAATMVPTTVVAAFAGGAAPAPGARG